MRLPACEEHWPLHDTCMRNLNEQIADLRLLIDLEEHHYRNARQNGTPDNELKLMLVSINRLKERLARLEGDVPNSEMPDPKTLSNGTV